MLGQSLTYVFSNLWELFLVVSVLMLGATELGFLVGLRTDRAQDEASKGQIQFLYSAVLGILALLVGFTFSMASERYQVRRDLVIEESNNIGTTYLRASLLPKRQEDDVEVLLRRYVDVRLDFFYAGEDKEKLAAAERSAAAIQRELWANAVAAAKEAPTPPTVSFITTLNDTIDIDATRLHALRSHVPSSVWLLVVAVAVCGCLVGGYGAGTTGARSRFCSYSLPLMMGLVITLIADLDRPRGGLIVISQQPLLDLKQSLQTRQP